jgi:LysM repeat protein
MLFSVPARRLSLFCLTLPLAAAIGCGSDLADDPLFNDQQAAVQRVDDDVAQLRSQIEELNRGMNNLLTEVENLKGEPLTGNVSGQRLEQRVEVLEAAMHQSNQALSKIRNEVEESVAAAPVRSPASSASASEKTSQSEASPSAPASSRVTLTRTPAPSKPAATPTPKPASGFYHTVESGETLASLAERFNVSPTEIRKANRIPEDGRLFVGQPIYIVR